MKHILGILPILSVLSCTAQQPNATATDLGVMFYNQENLYDTIDDPKVDDAIFLPDAERQWNTEKYNKKLSQMARVMAEGPGSLPALIGMCEVENASVLNDLIKEPVLANAKYKYVHFDSPDERGIDVALLYNPEYFKPTTSTAIPVKLVHGDSTDHTRDILLVSGTIMQNGKQETLHVFVNHWPSRREGEEASAWKRATAAAVLKAAVDSLNRNYTDPNIIIMGDFNDTPFDASIQKVLGAQQEAAAYNDESLVDLMAAKQAGGLGSYNYKGNWQALDQIIISETMLDGTGLQIDGDKTTFIRKDWMLFHHNTYGDSPNRTYSGTKWYGGFSDHLPAYTALLIK